MKNEFVPYDIALALKELEFNEPCVGTCHAIGNIKGEFTFGIFQHPKRNSQANTVSGTHIGEEGCYAPLYQQAFRWFREKHRLIFQIKYLFNGNYAVVIHKNTHEYMNTIQDLTHACVYEIPDNYSYEEAELACLKKLIEIVKENKDK